MSSFLTMRSSGSTLSLLVALLALIIVLLPVPTPEALLIALVFLVLPISAAVAAIWSFLNLFFLRSPRYFIEFALAVAIITLFFFQVIRTPI